MKKIEVCPHCNAENEVKEDKAMTTTCVNCNKTIVLCQNCSYKWHNDESHCDDCPICDLANVMNCVRNGKKDEDIEKVLNALNPPLTDMTAGLPEGVDATFEDYMNDTEDEQFAKDVNGNLQCVAEAKVKYPNVQWDVKYWDCFRMIKEAYLDEKSSESDYLELVSQLRDKNKE